jgi:hypothetical protein
VALPVSLEEPPPEWNPDRLVRVLTAVSIATEFAVLVDSNPTASAAAAGLLALTIRILLDVK